MSFKRVITKPKGIILFILVLCVCVTIGLSIATFFEEEIIIFLRLFILFCVYAIYHFISSITIIRLYKKYFKVGFLKKYRYSEIESVALYDTVDYTFFFIPMSEKCLTITLENGESIHLRDNYLTNLWKVRWFLENRIIKKKSFNYNFDMHFSSEKIVNKTSPISTRTKLLPYGFYTILIVFILTIVLFFVGISTVSWWVFLIISLALFLLLFEAFNSNYIESNDEGVIVKNLIFTNKKTKIPLRLIEYVQIKTIHTEKNNNTVLIIHMIYHKEYKFGITSINEERTENIRKQIKKLGVSFY